MAPTFVSNHLPESECLKNVSCHALSEAQYEIMNVVWALVECSVGDVWKVLHERRGVSRNTVHTLIAAPGRKRDG